MNTLLALDPGGTPTAVNSRSATGWSLWSYDAITPLRPLEHGQIKGGFEKFLEWWAESGVPEQADEVVCESFRLDGRTPRPDTTPLKIEGALATLRPDTIYQPNAAKSHLTDAKIKDLGLWWKGEPHAIDSMRHAFALMKVRRHYATLMAAFPPPRLRAVDGVN